MIRPENWDMLRRLILDPNFSRLCELGYRIEHLSQRLQSQGKFVRAHLIREFFELSYTILNEAFSLIKIGETDETKKDITDDMRTFLSPFFKFDTKSGVVSLVDVGIEMEQAVKEHRLDIFVQTHFQPVMTYIHSKIYAALVKALKKQEMGFTKTFAYFYRQSALSLNIHIEKRIGAEEE